MSENFAGFETSSSSCFDLFVPSEGCFFEIFELFPGLRRGKLLREFAVFDFLVLFAGVTLPRSFDKTSGHNSSFFFHEALASQGAMKNFEKFTTPVSVLFFDEFLKISGRVGIGNFIAKA